MTESIPRRLTNVGTGAAAGTVIAAFAAPYFPNAPETISPDMWIHGYNMALVASLLAAGSQLALWIVGRIAERKKPDAPTA